MAEIVHWKEVVSIAKAMFNEKDNYAYFYGAKGVILTDQVMDSLWRAEPKYFSKYSPDEKKAIYEYSRGKYGLDCSGFVCEVLRRAGCLRELTYSTGLINSCLIKQDPLLIPAGGILYRNPGGNRHVGIDIGEGKFLHMAREGSSILIGDNHENYWEVGGRYPMIDYRDWAETPAQADPKALAQGNLKYCGRGIATARAYFTDMSVRKEPSMYSPVIGICPRDARVEVLEILEDEWLKIVWPGAEEGLAFVSNKKNAYFNIM